MGREIFYCHACGNRILEDDLRKGRALVFLDKVYCQACKGQAFEQLNAGGSAAPASAPVPAAAPASSRSAQERPAATPAKSTTLPGNRPSKIRSAPSAPGVRASQPASGIRAGSGVQRLPDPKAKLKLLIGSVIGVTALGAVLLVQILGSSSGDRPVTTGHRVTVSTPPPNPVDAAMREFEDFLATKPAPEAILDRCLKIEPLVKGTVYADRIANLKRRAQDDVEKAGLVRDLDEKFAAARKLAESDQGTYAKFPEVMGELKRLYSSAGLDFPDRAGPIKEVMDRYSGPYEAEAQKVADEVGPVAERLARQEKRPQDAVKYIDANFPERLRHSKAWSQLRTERNRYERMEEEETLVPETPPELTTWQEYFMRAGNLLGEKDYAGALKDYLAGAKLLPPEVSKLSGEEKAMAIWGKYNIACLYFIEGKAATGAEKKKANDSGFEWLNKCGADGVMGLSTPGEGGKPVKAPDFIAKDPDLDGIRKDPRYEEFMKKYKK